MDKNEINHKNSGNKLFLKVENRCYFLLLLNLIIFSLSITLSSENSYYKKLNSNGEIILTVIGTNQKQIMNSQYNYPPNEVEINGERFAYNSDVEESEKYFFDCPEQENIIILYYEYTPESFNYMFKDITCLEKIDFSNFDSSNVNDMSYMFFGSYYLKEINMKGLKTSAVTSMKSMFQNCHAIISLDLSDFDTSSVINMKEMFANCYALEYLNISNFNTFLVEDMSSIFLDCHSIKSLDLSTFNVKNANMSYMFSGCFYLESIKLSDSNKLVTNNIRGMFHECRKLSSIDLSHFETSKVTDMSHLFNSCQSLTSINLSTLDTSSVTDFSNMFSFCSSLEVLNLSNFKTELAKNMDYMFQGCLSLVYLNLNSFVINYNISISNMFAYFTEYIKICINKETANIIFLNNGHLNYDCDDICFSPPNKIIFENKKCVKECIDDYNFKYEYNNKCYITCPKGTIQSTNNEFICEKIFNCSNYSNVEKTKCYETIPEGYFLVNIEEKIIDKCHENCKTCNKKGTESNNNCLTCKIDYYFYQGNCLENCQNDFYIDNYFNKICKCLSFKKCKECSEESISKNLCISCNEGYYQIYGEDNYPFVNCYDKLEGYYLDEIEHFFKKCYLTCKECSNFGDNINHNCDTCLENYDFINDINKNKNCYQKCQYFYYFLSENEYKCTDNNECPPLFSKLIVNKRKCIDNCINDNEYQYEYNNECFNKCPENSIPEGNICKDIIIEETDSPKTQLLINTEIIEKIEMTEITKNSQNIKNTEIIDISENSEILYNWSAENFFQGLYNISNKNKIKKDDIIQNIRKDIINHKLDTLISNVIEEKEDIYIKEDNTLYQITTSDNQNNNIYSNISSIKLGKCEEILKEKYNISKNDSLVILKIDYNLNGLLIPIIGYEVYHPKYKYKLNISYCEESSINYYIPVSIDEDKLFKYDPNSEYYNDECNTYTTENGTDIILDDRKDEFTYNNMSLCENICQYIEYNQENKKALCECGIRYKEFVIADLDNDTNLLANNLTYDNRTSNFIIMKCFEVLFSEKGLLTNIGSYILLIIFVLHLFCTIIFIKCGFQIIQNIIQDILAEEKKIRKTKNSSRRKTNIFEVQLKSKKNSYFNFAQIKGLSIFKKNNNNSNPIKKNKSKGKKPSFKESQINSSIDNKTYLPLKLKEKKKSKENDEKENKEKTDIIQKKFIRKKRKSRTSKTNKEIKDEIINKISKKIDLKFYNDYELNMLDYNEALIGDNRTLWKYYLSLLKTKHPLCSFFPIKDFNLTLIKICLFFFSFSIYYAFNTIFFNLTVIHKIYEEKGRYNIAYLMPKIIYSFIISYIINFLIRFVIFSERNILLIKKEKSIIEDKEKIHTIKKCIYIKNICYFIFAIIFIGIFWYYLSSFCAVYQNTQVYLIKNTFYSFIFGIIFPFFINIFPAIFRKFSLMNKNREWVYNMSKIIQLI